MKKSKKNRKSNKKTKRYYGGFNINQDSDEAAKTAIDALTYEYSNDLKSIIISTNSGLTKIPDLTRFVNLEEVFIQNDYMQGNISLENFDVNNLPKNIRILSIYRTYIKKMPDLTRFTQLEKLDFLNNEKMESIGKLPSSIKYIYVGYCSKLSHFMFGKFPEGLTDLIIHHCPSIEIIPKIPFVKDNPIRRVGINMDFYSSIVAFNKNDRARSKDEHKTYIENINRIFDEKVREQRETVEREFSPNNIFAKLGDDFRTLDVAEYLRKNAEKHAKEHLKPVSSQYTRKRKNEDGDENHIITVNKKRDARRKLDKRITKKSRWNSPESLPTLFGVNKIDENPNKLDEQMEKITEKFDKENPFYPKEVYERFDKPI